MKPQRLQGQLLEVQRWIEQTQACIDIVAANPALSTLGAEEALRMMRALLHRDRLRRDALKDQVQRATP